MKRFSYTLALLFTLFSFITINAQATAEPDSTGLPGDNFSLQGALALFKQAGSPEAFEKQINTEGNDVNNLDLNGDGDIDYVRVIDKKEGELHALVLQVPVSESESQDIAVIELEKTGDKTAILQIVGDEDIYGEETIIEPVQDGDETSYLNSPASFSDNLSIDRTANAMIVNVWLWPSVQYVYAPAYRVWVSPWSWRSRPNWWRPWRPMGYAVFYPRRVRYQRHYVLAPSLRVVRVHRIYTPGRVTSVTVRTRHQASVVRYRTTGRRTVVAPGNGRKVRATKRAIRRKRH